MVACANNHHAFILKSSNLFCTIIGGCAFYIHTILIGELNEKNTVFLIIADFTFVTDFS